MCGIAGILDRVGAGVDAASLVRMARLMRHRGPDDAGFVFAPRGGGSATAYADDDTMPGVVGGAFPYAPSGRTPPGPACGADAVVGLAGRRLAVVDLSPAGHQPMCDARAHTWIVHNGEIYNHHEIRRELERAGRRFRSATDTEVVLEAYLEWGVDCLQRFNGMWGFAIWDAPRARLFVARDRFGIKPIYYAEAAGRLAFASEVKPLLALAADREADLGAVHDFLRFGFSDHTEATFFAGISRLPAGSYLLADAGTAPQVHRYWDLCVNPAISGGPTPERAARDVRDGLFDAVALTLRADVPVGSCLSGGLDSSSVVCAAASLRADSGAPAQHAFTSCFDDPAIDERGFADAVLRHTGAVGHRVFPSLEDFDADLDNLIWHQEEPFAGTSLFAQWSVMRAARRAGVVVMLDGQGGDELLCGYRKFLLFYFRELLQRGALATLASEFARFATSPGVLGTLNAKSGLRYIGGARRLADIGAWLSPALTGAARLGAAAFGAGTGLAARIHADLFRFSVPVLLRYEDRNSMAHSVEARLPLLDHRFAETVSALPLDHKIRRGYTKYVLREAMRGVLPEAVRRRRSKLGFSTPQDLWLRSDAIRTRFADALDASVFLRDHLDLGRAREAHRAYLAGRSWLTPGVFYRLLFTELWARRFLGAGPLPARAAA